jgi:hypothetical protein
MTTRGKGTTRVGFVSDLGQVVIRNTGLAGNDKNQTIYQLGCSFCGHVYGANGADIHLRRCPQHDGGAVGLPLPPSWSCSRGWVRILSA